MQELFAICFCISYVVLRSQGEWGRVAMQLPLHIDLKILTYGLYFKFHILGSQNVILATCLVFCIVIITDIRCVPKYSMLRANSLGKA